MAKKTVWQNHHITYKPEVVVRITKGEHFIVTRMQWLKSASMGGILAMRHEINRLWNLGTSKGFRGEELCPISKKKSAKNSKKR